MTRAARRWLAALTCLVGATLLAGCMMNSIPGNDGGSEPINQQEEQDYKKAITRCYKTGGTRIVKIMGKLQCY